MATTDLSRYDNSWYRTGRNLIVRGLWFFVHAMFLKNPWNPFSGLKIFFLRMFGAKIGKGVVLKPGIQVKYPWRLEIGSYSWVGENSWIDNLVAVKIGRNCCISQGAVLLTGNHKYNKATFDLVTGEITLEDGVWIGAFAIVTAGVTCKSHSVLAVKSVAVSDLEPFSVYQGNPADLVRQRVISE